MASQKQYTATFAIGAKLLGSFRGVMAQAQSRLQKLRAVASGAVGGITSVLKRFAGVLSLFAAFAGASVFHSIFEGAQEEAAAAEQRIRKLSVLLLQNNQIRLKGLGFAKEQTELIFRANAVLAKQGVIGKQVLNNAAAQLAIFGYSPKKIAGMMAPLSDVLVTMKGVNATTEDSAELANAWGRAVKTGMAKPMAQFGFILAPQARKEFMKMSAAARNAKLLDWSKSFGGENHRALLTNLGTIQFMRNAIGDLSDEIGEAVLPAQAKMAAAWSHALPAIKPILISAMNGLVQGITGLAGIVENNLVPAWHEFQAFLDGPLGAALGRVKASWNEMVHQVGPEFLKMFASLTGGANGLKMSAGDVLIAALGKLAGILKFVGNNASWLVPLVTSLTVGLYALSAAIGVVAAIAALNPLTWIAVGMVALIAGLIVLHQKFGTLGNLLQWLWDKFVAGLSKSWMELKQRWTELETIFAAGKDAFMIVFQSIGDSITNFILHPINAIKDAWSSSVDFIKRNVPTWAGGTGVSPTQVPNMGGFEGMATGGIVRGHSLLQVAERGPEAIIPLSGGRRAQGLLHYAARAIGMGSTSNGPAAVNYAPNITINGNVSASEQRALKATLRQERQDFIASFKAAQAHERRLSFESGY